MTKEKKYSKASPEMEAKINKIAREGKIVFEDTYEIEEYERELTTLLKDLLALNIHECFISDKSQMGDFNGCGYTSLSGEEWYKWAENKMYLRFGIHFTGNPYLLDLCKQIREKRGIGSGLN
jgi:hypothetical protein